ncbi:hypothetical protein COK38_21560 [Bacillus cereus]|uniref:Uncharacterized protein n=1 Tax=Bacillus cereus TaxID=1396 RepID=A0AA44Q7K5_BACCE|nr:hypothetical protein COJ55_03710 [Bacillus cereus]PFR95128.1 hypothetical protein COK38_21560 [Bacillus cereus]
MDIKSVENVKKILLTPLSIEVNIIDKLINVTEKSRDPHFIDCIQVLYRIVPDVDLFLLKKNEWPFILPLSHWNHLN